MKKITAAVAASLLALALGAQNGPVKIWEGTIDLPTYRVNAPEKAPLFARDFAYQRAKRWVYPYAMNDNPTYTRVDSTHRALFLENDYLKVCVLPDIGGRLLYATDKTNGYEIFYRQHAIKPANVGMLGAWISGGVEWNVFHHHRATSQYPIDWRLVDNGNGSKTIWIGEAENRHRMSWAIGLTLYPDKSYIEVTGRFFNDSPDRNSMLHWNNIATHANKDYQILFPANTKFGMFHHKFSHIHWPVANEPYKGNADFIGVDVSLWKNLPSLTGDSVFIQDLQDDWVGGYDYGKNAGTMLAGNHNINKGGKFWTWGHKAYGHMWDCVTLTDEDGAYVELMTSAYSDNQPDYCWINPGETKEFTAYWYGIRNMKNGAIDDIQSEDEICVRGNEKATVNLEIESDGSVHIAANTTQKRAGAKIVVEKRRDLPGLPKDSFYEKTVTIAPDKPFRDDFKISAADAEDPTSICIKLYAADGELLIEHHPYKHDINSPLPEDLKPVNPDPKSVKNTEECYYIGLRNLQFHQAHVDPNDYFLEVLSRDPGDVRANTQMGIYHRKNGNYEAAKAYLRKAIARQTANYTRPSDGEAMYNLGLILKEEANCCPEGRWHDAIDTLYRAVWDYEYASAAYLQLAQISSLKGNAVQALHEAQMSVNYNGMNVDAKDLVVSLLRKAGKKAEAIAMAKEVQKFDPLNYYAVRELVLLGALPKAEFAKLLRGVSESYLTLAIQYFQNGFAAEGKAILEEAEAIKPYPTIEYYLGYLASPKDGCGDTDKAAEWFRKAAAGSIDYVYPFRLETVRVLGRALELIPDCAVTWYYLGNLWYQKQPEKALECWSKAAELKPDFAMVLRNIGWYWRFKDEYHQKDPADYQKALDFYLKAIAADKEGSAIFLTEADEIMERLNSPLQARYELFMAKPEISDKRYDSEVRKIRQIILHGDYEDALEPLLTRTYSRREHIDDLHDMYVDLCQLAGRRAWAAGDNEGALRYMLMSAEYPENQFYAHLEYYARDAQVNYLIGLAYEKLGDGENARKYYEIAANTEVKPKDIVYNYEKGLAQRKLDKGAKVRALYKDILKAGKAMKTDYVQNFFESFDRGEYVNDVNARAYYLQGIGHLALGHKCAAKRAFRKALKERNDNTWALWYTGKIK